MPLPNDPENRWWVEASAANPTLVNELRPAMAAFVAFRHDGQPEIAGSGFVIAGVAQAAVIMTAKHVLHEGVLRTQQPLTRHASSALFIRASTVTPSLEPKKLKILWMGHDHPLMLNAPYACSNNTLDNACLICTPQEGEEGRFLPTSIPLDCKIPEVGGLIYMISYDQLSVADFSTTPSDSGDTRIFTLTKRISIRAGVVTKVFLSGFRQYRWPCFTTSIPAEPGMSGGMVVAPSPGETIAACGIVCADNSDVAARSDSSKCGESVIACAWPALSLCLPTSMPVNLSGKKETIYDFMRSGRMPSAKGGINLIDVIDLGNGDYRIRNRQR